MLRRGGGNPLKYVSTASRRKKIGKPKSKGIKLTTSGLDLLALKLTEIRSQTGGIGREN